MGATELRDEGAIPRESTKTAVGAANRVATARRRRLTAGTIARCAGRSRVSAARWSRWACSSCSSLCTSCGARESSPPAPRTSSSSDFEKQLAAGRQPGRATDDDHGANRPDRHPCTTSTTVRTVQRSPSTDPEVRRGRGHASTSRRSGSTSRSSKGSSLDELREGPRPLPADTPLPGTLGNAAIAGHRTTYLHSVLPHRRAEEGRQDHHHDARRASSRTR